MPQTTYFYDFFMLMKNNAYYITLIICEQTIRVKYQALFDYDTNGLLSWLSSVAIWDIAFKVQLIPIRQVTTRLTEMTIIPS